MVLFMLLLLGLGLLTLGADVLVRGAGRLAAAVGLPSLVIGLTVVAFGTSAPELAVSVRASLADQAGIALGNVVGSNTFNVLFILGVSALIVPLAAHAQLVRLDVPIMIVVSGALWWCASDGEVNRVEGGLMVAGLVAYTTLLIVMGLRNPDTVPGSVTTTDTPAPPPGRYRLVIAAGQIVLGLAMLVLGAHWLVQAAVTLARWMGVSELMIGLTLVAAGTSLPEVATSIMASLRGQRDIAIGNVVGSNIFNILGVLGISAAVADGGVPVAPEALRFDIPVTVAVAIACLPIFFTGGRISRGEGMLLLTYYVAYVAFLVLAALRHAALETFSAAMLWFAIPLTVLGLTVSVWAAVRTRLGRSSVSR